ncbi:MAG: OmpH family outer membrane protein [Holosporaceae bacterium]|jgi:Skp family chaperone for outer membrane proteins|nr:OmpH family outer membrane protein [Holosporaceae bacterium]
MKFSILLLLFASFSAYGHGFLATVDWKRVAVESLAGKSIEEQVKSINDHAKKDLLALELKIKEMESNKKADYDSRKIEDMQLILYDMVRSKKYQIAEAYRKAVAMLEEEARKIIAKVCKEKGISVVVNAEAVVYTAAENMDITMEVIKELNGRLQKVNVEVKESE